MSNDKLDKELNQLSLDDDQQNYMKGVIVSLGWYKKQYFRMVFAFGLASLVSIMSLSGNLAQYIMKPNPKYFAQTPDLRITELVALDQPYITQEGLVNWMAETVSRTLSLDFLHYRDTLMAVKDNYTDNSFNELIASLKSNGTIEMIKEKRLSASVSVEKAPVITNSGVISGVMSWKLEFPLVVTYESSSGTNNAQHLVATVIVQRADTLTNPKGVVIKQLLLAVNDKH